MIGFLIAFLGQPKSAAAEGSAPTNDVTVVQTTANPETTSPPPLGPIVPATPQSGGPTAVLYVILLVTMPLITVATLVWLHTNRRYNL